MILSKTSWHFKLHEMLYGKGAKLPMNFCPYFWKTIMLGIVLFVPLNIIGLPMLLLEAIAGKFTRRRRTFKERENGFFSEYFFMCLLFNAFVFIVYCMVAVWFMPSFWKHYSFVSTVGLAGYVIIILLLIVYLHGLWSDWRKERRQAKWKARNQQFYRDGLAGYVPKEKKPNVFIEYIKAWYKKNCPLIDWK